MRIALVAVAPLALALAACTHQVAVGVDPLRHVVLVDLKNPSDVREFSTDCFQLMQCPQAANVVTGPRLDTGRAEALTDFDVATEIGLSGPGACSRLLDHPAYTALMAKWRPRANSIQTATFGPRCEDEPVAPANGQKPTTGN